MTLLQFVKALKLSNNEQTDLFYMNGQTETSIWTGKISEIPIIYSEYPILSSGTYCDNSAVIHIGLVV